MRTRGLYVASCHDPLDLWYCKYSSLSLLLALHTHLYNDELFFTHTSLGRAGKGTLVSTYTIVAAYNRESEIHLYFYALKNTLDRATTNFVC